MWNHQRVTAVVAALLVLGVYCSSTAEALLTTDAGSSRILPGTQQRRCSARTTWLRSSSPLNEECSLDEDDVFNCLASQGYVEDDRLTVNKVFVAELEDLRDSFESFEKEGDVGSNMIKYNKRLRHGSKTNGSVSTIDDNDNTHTANMEYNHMVSDRELVLVDAVRKPGMQSVSRAFHRGGPRKLLHFDPSQVNAAIVTCGGLAPGLNTVIREVTHALKYLYGAKNVWGVVGGFNGFLGKEGYEPILLTNELVENIHHEGGTVLRSSRGGFDETKILEFLKEKDIQQLYVIGGDGTHRAAYKIRQACQINNLNVAIAGIPKTIDNDCGFIDRSFGFVSAVEAAQNSIRTAKTGAYAHDENDVFFFFA